MSGSGVADGSLYKINKGSITTMTGGISTGNGLAWNSNNTLMYYIDTNTRKVDVFDYNNGAGSISNRRTVYDFNTTGEAGSPDGMTIDASGNLWVGCWGGNQLIHVDTTTGRKARSVPLPTSNITSAAFGGPNLDILYVTSARSGLSETDLLNQPAAGSLFQITNLGVRGQSGGNAYVLEWLVAQDEAIWDNKSFISYLYVLVWCFFHLLLKS
jgi:gluconolactonase